ncbi:hypothetical protein QJS10_CPB19g01240 [Acorus calamus]|uniref:Spindle and kinetochore-associated protein 3 n=1 Tax=Acorus calamus TaxID=4465 RepID=A0AAV9CFA7_ACOCL|nr:hypothetical protein QJS10_CPB19g01240 [Acorus calamus]
MESSIKAFSKTLASMCDHIQISCDSLLDSVRRTPLPRESATETFLRCLDRRSSSAGADLEVLESMAFGTVSFEELLGHCNEVYKKNQSDLAEVEQRLEELGFEILMDGGDEVLDVEDEVDFALTYHGTASPASVIKKRFEEDPLYPLFDVS